MRKNIHNTKISNNLYQNIQRTSTTYWWKEKPIFKKSIRVEQTLHTHTHTHTINGGQAYEKRINLITVGI